MSDHSPSPVIFIACLSTLLLFAFPQVSHSQSAIRQLEDVSGGKIQRYSVKSPVPQSPAGSIGLMLFQSILGEALNAGNNSLEGAQQAAQRAELNAWLQAEQERLNNLVKQQRAKREAEDKAGSAEMAKALGGSGFDTPTPKSDLASALSDDNLVSKSSADSRETYSNFFGTGSAMLPRPAASPQAVPRKQDFKDLQKRINASRDTKKLYADLQKLQNDMEKAIQKAIELKRLANASRMQYESYEDYIRGLAKSLQNDGISLLWDLTPGLSGDYLSFRLTRLKNNPAKWNRTLKAMDNLNDYCSWISEYGGSAEGYAEYDWDKATHNLLDTINVLGENAPLISDYWKVGKFMIQGGLAISKANVVAKEIRNLDGVTPQYLQQTEAVKQEMAKLSPELRKVQEELAKKLKKLGIDPNLLKVETPTPTPHGLMKVIPPHPLD